MFLWLTLRGRRPRATGARAPGFTLQRLGIDVPGTQRHRVPRTRAVPASRHGAQLRTSQPACGDGRRARARSSRLNQSRRIRLLRAQLLRSPGVRGHLTRARLRRVLALLAGDVNRNPYAPPDAQVSDPEQRIPPIEKPRTVVLAIRLLWISLVVTFAGASIGWKEFSLPRRCRLAWRVWPSRR